MMMILYGGASIYFSKYFFLLFLSLELDKLVWCTHTFTHSTSMMHNISSCGVSCKGKKSLSLHIFIRTPYILYDTEIKLLQSRSVSVIICFLIHFLWERRFAPTWHSHHCQPSPSLFIIAKWNNTEANKSKLDTKTCKYCK